MNILVISHAPIDRGPSNWKLRTQQADHSLVYLFYGESTMGYRPDVFILLEPPLDEREEAWLNVAKHRSRPGTIYINPKGVVTTAYAEDSNDY